MAAMAVVFWVSLLAILYAYVGYTAVLWLMSRLAAPDQESHAGKEYFPSVTMIVSTYNEETVIGKKIENAHSLDYPRDRLEIVIVSDGSTDQTREIVLRYADHGAVLRHYEGRIGKTACLNRAVPLAAGEIIVFSDANSIYEKGALKALVSPFQSGQIGFVTGWTRYESEGGHGSDSLGLYSRLELITKELESRLGSCIGGDGAILAIRKSLYLPLKDYDINDFVIPLSIVERAHRGVLQKQAICIESDAGSIEGEFNRQLRISSRTIRAISNYRHLLNPYRFGFLSFELISHKLCRFLVPAFLVALLISNLVLAERGGVYLLTLTAQGIFYVAAGAASFMPGKNLLSRMTDAARIFVVVNFAIALAWVKYLKGETFTTWSPTKR